ncbi:MAG: histidine phosphatase family protein [Planctomycetes bacterium]|nr:histidine phosphatase family protein [Planctomycetota bacterium]
MASKRKSIVLSLIQCGETAWDAEGRLHGRTDLPLSTAGRVAVTEDAACLVSPGIATVHHSPDEAATETAQIVAKAVGAKTKSMAELAGVDLGVLDGLTEHDFAERYPKRYRQWQDDPVSLLPPEGEEVADARARMFSAVAKMLRRCRSGEVAVVLHSLGLGLLRCWLADRPPTEAWALVRARPRIERYTLAAEMIDWLEEAAKAQFSHS